MARTPRTLSRGGHPEAKAGENIGEGKSREDVTEKGKQNKISSKRSSRFYRFGVRAALCE